MEEIKSIWQGWTNQCYGRTRDGEGGNCAIGYLLEVGTLQAQQWVDLANPHVNRIGAYIQRNFELPETFDGWMRPSTDESDAIVYANNVLRLTPQQFRDIDIASQLEAAVKPLVDSVEVSKPEQCAQ